MGTTLPFPPKEMNFVGDGDFDAVGREFLRYFTEFAGLICLEVVNYTPSLIRTCRT